MKGDSMKEAIIFLAGIGVGFFGGYIFLKDKYEKDVEAEAEELRKYYKGKYGNKKEVKEEEDATEEVETEIPEEAKKAISEYSSSTDIEEGLAESEHPDDDYREGELLNYISSHKRPPYVIREDELDDFPHHDKTTLYYYTGDETFVDECDNIVDNIDGLLGDTVGEENFRFSDERTLYVRNIDLGSDYEVIKVDGSFSDIYLDH